MYLTFFFIDFVELNSFLRSPPCLSAPLQPTPKVLNAPNLLCKSCLFLLPSGGMQTFVSTMEVNMEVAQKIRSQPS